MCPMTLNILLLHLVNINAFYMICKQKDPVSKQE